MESFETFCCQLSTAIKKSGYSRAELADKLGVKPATIKSWCVGRRSPTVFRLLELVDILGLDADELFQAPPNPIVRTSCKVCGRSFRRLVGYRIHLALRAREDEQHKALHLTEDAAAILATPEEQATPTTPAMQTRASA